MTCQVCKDASGFYIRPCIGCRGQKLLTKERAEALHLPEGILVSNFIRQCVFREDIKAMNELFHRIRQVRNEVILRGLESK